MYGWVCLCVCGCVLGLFWTVKCCEGNMQKWDFFFVVIFFCSLHSFLHVFSFFSVFFYFRNTRSFSYLSFSFFSWIFLLIFVLLYSHFSDNNDIPLSFFLFFFLLSFIFFLLSFSIFHFIFYFFRDVFVGEVTDAVQREKIPMSQRHLHDIVNGTCIRIIQLFILIIKISQCFSDINKKNSLFIPPVPQVGVGMHLEVFLICLYH